MTNKQDELLPCPHCNGKPELIVLHERSGYAEYEHTTVRHAVRCNSCGALGKQIEQKPLVDFTQYRVSDFRGNPVLRAKVEDDYEAYVQQTKELAVAAWNTRPTPSDEVKRLEEALECLEYAQNGLRWYQDQYPEHASQADDDLHERINAVLTHKGGPSDEKRLEEGYVLSAASVRALIKEAKQYGRGEVTFGIISKDGNYRGVVCESVAVLSAAISQEAE